MNRYRSPSTSRCSRSCRYRPCCTSCTCRSIHCGSFSTSCCTRIPIHCCSFGTSCRTRFPIHSCSFGTSCCTRITIHRRSCSSRCCPCCSFGFTRFFTRYFTPNILSTSCCTWNLRSCSTSPSCRCTSISNHSANSTRWICQPWSRTSHRLLDCITSNSSWRLPPLNQRLLSNYGFMNHWCTHFVYTSTSQCTLSSRQINLILWNRTEWLPFLHLHKSK